MIGDYHCRIPILFLSFALFKARLIQPLFNNEDLGNTWAPGKAYEYTFAGLGVGDISSFRPIDFID